MITAIDKFQGAVSDYFRQLTLSVAYLNIGDRVINSSPDNASVELSLAKDIKTEPYYLKELLLHNLYVEEGILEHHQNKMISAWSDLLNEIFSSLVGLHFSSVRNFHELKKRTVQLDFSSETELNEQIMTKLVVDFTFQRYSERVKIIDDVLNSDGKHKPELSTIKKHVLIRNAVQHHGSKVYRDMLKELGCARLEVLDRNADEKFLDVSEQIILAVPELDAIKRALFRVSNEWRKNSGEDSNGGNP
jgi:hypothetical protein